MLDLDETKFDLGVFWPSEYDANIRFALASFNLHLQNISPTSLMANFSEKNNANPKKNCREANEKNVDLKIKCTNLKWSYQIYLNFDYCPT